MKSLDVFAIVWLTVWSLITFVAFGLDKWRAGRSGNRISERALVFLGAVGGWPGGWLGMICFRHKTVKFSFRVKFGLGLLPFASLFWLWWRWR